MSNTKKTASTMEQDTLHGNAKETIKPDSSKLVEAFPIENTPFMARKMDETWFITMGRYKIADNLTSFEECEEVLSQPTWNLTCDIMQAMIETNLKNFAEEGAKAAREFAKSQGLLPAEDANQLVLPYNEHDETANALNK